MKNFIEAGQKIGHVLNNLGAEEVIVNGIATFQQAIKNCLDVEILVNGNTVFSFKDLNEENCTDMFESIHNEFKGSVIVRQILPFIEVMGETVLYKSTILNTNNIVAGEVVKKEEYEMVIKHHNNFHISMNDLAIIQKLHQKQCVAN